MDNQSTTNAQSLSRQSPSRASHLKIYILLAGFIFFFLTTITLSVLYGLEKSTKKPMDRWVSALNPITYSRATLQNLLNNGGYAIVSAGRNLPSECNLTNETIQERTDYLIADLTNQFVYSSVLGVYNGDSETSFLVILHNTSPNEDRKEIIRLGKKYNQESVIYVKRVTPTIEQLIFTTGADAGKIIEAGSYSELPANVTDNYSSLQLCSNDSFTFTINFKFERVIVGKTAIKTQQIVDHFANNRMINQRNQKSGICG